jgi:peptidoglycan lytic transglycosylase
MRLRTGLMLCTALLLAACGTAPHRAGGGSGGYLPGDGPGNEDAARLAAVPDAVPRDEPLHRYANRPYDALGVHYVPLTAPGHYKQRGTASWYGKKFHGQRTSSGEIYNMYAMSAAHKTLPIPSYARVTNLANGRSVIVRVNDRGPFVADRIMDLSYAAAYKLGMLQAGRAEVEVESLMPGEDIPAAQPLDAAPVQVEALPPAALPAPSAAPPAPAASPVVSAAAPPQTPEGDVFLQLGSFRSMAGAQEYLGRMRAKLGSIDKELTLLSRGGLTRVRIGPYRTTEEARGAADALFPRLGFKPFVSAH